MACQELAFNRLPADPGCEGEHLPTASVPTDELAIAEPDLEAAVAEPAEPAQPAQPAEPAESAESASSASSASVESHENARRTLPAHDEYW